MGQSKIRSKKGIGSKIRTAGERPREWEMGVGVPYKPTSLEDWGKEGKGMEKGGEGTEQPVTPLR